MLDATSVHASVPLQSNCHVHQEGHPEVSGLVGRLAGDQAEVRLHNGSSVWVAITDLRCAFQPGTEVEHLPGQRRSLGEGRVEAVRTLAGRDQCAVLLFDDGTTRWLPFEALAYCADVPLRATHGMLGIHEDHAERFRLRSLAASLESWNATTGAFGRLDIDPLPHQINVARRVAGALHPGWLIADDVGLGKTIEMGLILHALRKQGRGRRALIVCPSSLVTQWKQEMRDRFGHPFVIYGRDVMPETSDDLAAQDGVIVSMDLAKREDHRARLCGLDWDVVVVDEAHRLGMAEDGTRTERYRLGEDLRARTPTLILLTATPHQGKSRRFAALLDLARPDLADEIAALDAHPEVVSEVVIRNLKTKVTDAAGELLFRGHDTRRVQAAPSLEGRAFDAALQDYLRHGYAAAERLDGTAGRAIGFVMATYRKLASSSLAAITRALARRRARLIDGEAVGDAHERLTRGDLLSDDLADADLFGGHAFFANEADEIDRLLALADAARATDAKGALFSEQILTPLAAEGEPLLIFTEYRATQDWLADVCRNLLGEDAVATINGSMDVDARTTEIERFTEGAARVMISTEAGGEGLNLQRRCHVMLNYDLPWNPSRLVQRIGRLYRYGQYKRVQVINLSVDDGFDAQILNLMLERVTTMAHDLASVDVRNAEGLASDILGELLQQIDMEDLLARATTMRIERTAAEVEEAVRRAKDARADEAEILSFAEGGHVATTLELDHRHLVALVEGVAPRMGIEVRRADRDAGRIDVTLPDALVGTMPDYGRASRLTLIAPRVSARRPSDAVPLDLEAQFVSLMIRHARSRDFDGMLCGASNLLHQTIGLLRLRGADDRGIPLAERIILAYRNDMGTWVELPSERASKFFLDSISSCAPDTWVSPQTDALATSAEKLLRSDCIDGRYYPLFWRLEALAHRE